MYIIYIKIFDFGVVFLKPFFDNFGFSRNWCEPAEKNFTTRDLKNVLFG